MPFIPPTALDWIAAGSPGKVHRFRKDQVEAYYADSNNNTIVRLKSGAELWLAGNLTEGLDRALGLLVDTKTPRYKAAERVQVDYM